MPLKEHFGFDKGVYSARLIADSLIHYWNTGKYKKIIFLSHTEALSVYYIKAMNKIVNVLVKNYDFDVNDILYVAGAHPVQENIVAYQNICKEYNFNEVPILLVNFMEIVTNHANVGANVDFDNQVITKPRIKLKKFLSLNGVPRLFRIVLFSQLLKHNLLDNAHYTFWLNTKDRLNVNAMADHYITQAKTQFPTLTSEAVYLIQKHSSKFPAMLYEHFENTKVYNQNDVFLYNTSYFSLVAETVFASNKGLDDDLFYECYDFSEKLFRAIKFKHPFILAARPNSLKVLREYGYKTFHPYINESYDNIENDEERLLAIVNEVKRLCNMNDKQWLEWQLNVKSIVEHNHKFLNEVGIRKLDESSLNKDTAL
jgi:hypothetical protein